MKVIIDSGSTKSKWKIGEKVLSYPGMNPLFTSANSLDLTFATAANELKGETIDSIEFYGSGIVSGAEAESIRVLAAQYFPDASFLAGSDLLLAAKSLFAGESGIACIIGTGSNACYYNGDVIVDKIASGGYVIGDEGSGSYFGKNLISDFIKQQLPEDLSTDFSKAYDLDYSAIVRKLYKEPGANKFLASFSSFAKQHVDHPYIISAISDGFDAFIKRNVLPLSGKHAMNRIGVVGGFGFEFRSILEEVASKYNLTVEKCLQAPL